MMLNQMTKTKENNFMSNSTNFMKNVTQSELVHSSVVSNNDIGLESFADTGAYNIPIENNSPDVNNHAANTIRVLADMFTCRLSNFPMTVGIFSQQNNKEYLSHLASELHNLDRFGNPIPLKFSKLLFIFPLVISAILGYFVGMLTNWQVGLSIGHIGMFIQITFLALIITGSRFCHKPMAIRASYSVACFLHWVKLFLSVCFCYPIKSVNTKTPVRLIVVYHRICPSSTTNIALFSLVEKMWFGLLRHYGQILIRLQRAGKPSGSPSCKYKRVCCLPAFVVMIAFWISFLISTSIMRLYSGQLAKLLGHGGLLSLFVIMSSIMFLSFFGSLPSLFRIIKGLLINPITPVKSALAAFLQTNNEMDKEFYNTKSAGKVNEAAFLASSTSFKDLAISAEEQRACKADLFVKSEFAKICNLSVTFDRFTNTQQTRFILCLDASSTSQKDLLAKLIYQIHNLILSDISAPVAVVLEANFKILLGDLVCSAILSSYSAAFCSNLTLEPKLITQIVSDNVHLVHASLHLPIYLEPPIFTDFNELTKSYNEHSKQNQHSHSSLNDYSPMIPTLQPKTISTGVISNINTTSRKVSCNPNCISSNIPRAMFNNSYGTHMNNQQKSKIIPVNSETEQNKIDFTGEYEIINFSDIARMFLHNHELADWNGKVIKQLVLSTTFTYRLLKLYNMNIETGLIVTWITLVHHWPYHTTWLIIYLEELNTSNSMNSNNEQNHEVKINLMEAFLEIKKRVSESIEILESLAIEDRDLERLNKFLYSKTSTQIPLNTLKQLIACTLIHNPFIRYSIQALVGSMNRRQSSGLQHGFVNPLSSLVEEKSGNAIYNISLDKFGQSSSVTVNTSIQSNTSKVQANQMGCKTASSLSSAENTPSNTYWPCPSDTIAAGDNALNKSCQLTLKKMYPTLPFNKFTVNDVCELFSSIGSIHPTHLQSYISKIKQLNINGIVLSVCDLEKLKQELMINTEDWQQIYKLLTWLRSLPTDEFRAFTEKSQYTSGIASNDFDEGDLIDGYNINLISKDQQPRNPISSHTLVTSVPSLNSEIISHASERQFKTSNPFLVRQTPWLISPKIPITSLSSNGKSLEPFQEFTHQQRPSPDNSDQQNSCSAMEEPESLWKTNNLTYVPTNADKVLVKQQSLLNATNEKSRIMHNANLFFFTENFSKQKEVRRTSKHQNNAEEDIDKSEVKVAPNYSFIKDIQNSCHFNRFAIKNGYASRSSIDLRTVFGPEPKSISNSNLLSNYRIIHNSKRNRVKKALIEQHRRRPHRRLLTNTSNFNYFVDPEFYPSPFVCPVSNHNTAFYNQDLLGNTNLSFDSNLHNTKVPNLRRITKQPRLKYDYQNIKNNAPLFIGNGYNNGSSNNNGEHINSITPNKILIKQSQLQEPLNNVESETDDTVQSSENKSSHIKIMKQNKSFLDHLKYYPSRNIHAKAVFPSPALTPAQLASLQAYTAWSAEMNPYLSNATIMTNTGSVIPNNSANFWNSYLEQSPNKFYLFKPKSHKKSDHKAFRPSQKKRPRKTNPEEEKFIINSNTKFPLTNLIKSNGYSLTTSCDSDAEICTCDYWYELEKSREKFTISEPSLRAESDLISIDDCIFDNESQTSAGESLNSLDILKIDKSKSSK
ncbi:Kinase D-interacting substrate [Schistosoma japonicum]|uniref:Kinase D-interacting substrate n=2 Tax=Schistosoma japonicum TaxID=6182 RepID=A0A4Z2DVE7_SCHJA|nr:Kinase D-interacting substrate [Schistosoma japonicum]